MSVVPTSGIGSLVAGVQTAQGRGDTDRAVQDASSQQRVSQLAAGAEQVQGEATTHERDADGRLPYQRPGQRQTAGDALATEHDPAQPDPLVKDPTGQTGTELDLVG